MIWETRELYLSFSCCPWAYTKLESKSRKEFLGHDTYFSDSDFFPKHVQLDLHKLNMHGLNLLKALHKCSQPFSSEAHLTCHVHFILLFVDSFGAYMASHVHWGKKE